jgi:hypothetical protein
VQSILDLIRTRPTALFLAVVVVPSAVMTAVFGWQAVESQEVKNALRGGLDDGSLVVQGDVGTVVAFGTPFVNEGDTAITLEDVGLIVPDEGIELSDVRAAVTDEPATPFVSEDGVPAGAAELEETEVGPGQAVSVIVGVEITEEGDALGFDGIRVHYHAGGRAGETVAYGSYGTCAPLPACDPSAPSGTAASGAP